MLAQPATAAVLCTVWLAHLNQLRPTHEVLLAKQEVARAAKFRLEADRSRFVLATALLRCAVARRLGGSAAAVQLDRRCRDCGREHGRPRLPGTGLAASLSHSGDLVAVALTEGQAVGVDVEQITGIDYVSLLGHVCAPEELSHVISPAAFYSYWTRKEAILKATGAGLRMPMSSVVVSPPGGAPLLISGGLSSMPSGSQLADLEVPTGYAGAVAVLTECPVTIALGDPADVLA
jgi:4'-phosphopantetheinyl transferase